MPATSIFMSAPSAGTSGIGNSRNSVLPAPVRTAARTVCATFLLLPLDSLFSHAGKIGENSAGNPGGGPP
jgi:hypothetical protein